MSDDYVQGSQCKLYIGADASPPVLTSLVELSEARDVNFDPSVTEVDATTRANGGYKSTAPGLKDLSIDFDMLYKPANTNYATIRDAYLAGVPISAACLTDAKDAENTEGPLGRWTVTKFTRAEGLDDTVKIQVTLKIFEFTEWVGSTASS